MLTWLSANLINIVLIMLLALISGLVIRGMIRDRKAGKHNCGGNCANCGACSRCGETAVRSQGGCSCCSRYSEKDKPV